MTAQDRLVGALIGLSRAVDNNEHLITPDTNAALLRALTASPPEAEAALTALQQQKRLLVPNCFDCAAPCGRTADCDFPALLDAAPDARDARLSLLDALRTIARAQSTPDPEACAFLYRALLALGTETYAPADLQPYQIEAETRLHP